MNSHTNLSYRRGLKIVEGICRKNQSASYPDPESQQSLLPIKFRLKPKF